MSDETRERLYRGHLETDVPIAAQLAELLAMLNALHIRVDELATLISENATKIDELASQLGVDLKE